METLSLIKDTPVPTILIIGGLLFLLLSVANQLGGKITVEKKRQNLAIVIGAVLTLLGIFLYFIPANQTTTTYAPEIKGVTIRESIEDDGLVVYQEINFIDKDGDTNYVKWNIIALSDPAQREFINITNGNVNTFSEEQAQGASTLAEWHCQGRIYTIELEVTLFDASGNRSEPYSYSIVCK